MEVGDVEQSGEVAAEQGSGTEGRGYGSIGLGELGYGHSIGVHTDTHTHT